MLKSQWLHVRACVCLSDSLPWQKQGNNSTRAGLSCALISFSSTLYVTDKRTTPNPHCAVLQWQHTHTLRFNGHRHIFSWAEMYWFKGKHAWCMISVRIQDIHNCRQYAACIKTKTTINLSSLFVCDVCRGMPSDSDTPPRFSLPDSWFFTPPSSTPSPPLLLSTN